MSKSRCLILWFVFATLSVGVHSHSWLDCVNYTPSSINSINQAVVSDCKGFERGYTSRDVNPDGSMYKITDPSPNLPACRKDASSYTSKFPMTVAKPGQTLTMLWTPNGHTMWHPTPPPHGPRQVYMKWSGQPNKELSTMGEVRRALDFIPSIQFDTACHNRQTCAELDSSGGLCTWDYTLPANLPAGKYQFVWWWPFDFAGDSVTEEYVSCWDVQVEGTPVTPTPNTGSCVVGGVGKYNGTSGTPVPTPTPTPSPAPTPSTSITNVTLYAYEDSYTDGSNPTANHATSSTLYAQRFSTDSQGTKEIFLRFNIGSVLNGKYIKSVELELSPINPSALDLRVQSVSNNWEENTINFNNKPAPNWFVGLFNNQNNVALKADIIQRDVTNNGGIITLRVFKELASSTLYQIYSRENDNSKVPTLKLELSPTPVYIVEGANNDTATDDIASASTICRGAFLILVAVLLLL